MPLDIAIAPERIMQEAWADVGPAALIDHILRPLS